MCLDRRSDLYGHTQRTPICKLTSTLSQPSDAVIEEVPIKCILSKDSKDSLWLASGVKLLKGAPGTAHIDLERDLRQASLALNLETVCAAIGSKHWVIAPKLSRSKNEGHSHSACARLDDVHHEKRENIAYLCIALQSRQSA
ncbi:hypothetical protein DFH09DRAFT_1105620 [Mycena vulgaris]|nr:hypothetical protein DFH09DRAFT_1105620 [Mycena vulgaris]